MESRNPIDPPFTAKRAILEIDGQPFDDNTTLFYQIEARFSTGMNKGSPSVTLKASYQAEI